MDLPQDLISLILEFAVGKDIDALPLYHVCREFKDQVAEIQRKKRPHNTSRLFFNLSVKALKHLSIIQVKWLIAVKAPPEEVTKVACKSGNLEVLQSQTCPRYCFLAVAYAARGGHLEVVKWLRANHCPWSSEAVEYAAEGGHLEVVKWLRDHGCPWTSWAVAYAAKGGHLEVIKWLRDHGCHWTSWTVAYAAKEGHLEVVKWLRANHCPWSSEALEYAAEGGHLEVVKWLRDHGCPWSSRAIVYAVEGGHLEVIKWLRENGCPE